MCMNRFILLLFLATAACSGEKPGDNIKSLQWLEGDWINDQEPETTSSEHWVIASPLSLLGTGLTVSTKKDTIFFEKLEIRQEKGHLYYIADIGNGPVKFKLTSRSKNKWVFSNPDHDFPKKITYSRAITNSEEWLMATAESNGKAIPFNFKKVRNER